MASILFDTTHLAILTDLSIDHWWKPKAGVATSDPDPCRDDEISARVKVAESEVVQIAKVWLRVLDLGHFVVVLYDWMEHLLKHVIGLGVTGVDPTAAVQVLTSYISVNVEFSKVCLFLYI